MHRFPKTRRLFCLLFFPIKNMIYFNAYFYLVTSFDQSNHHRKIQSIVYLINFLVVTKGLQFLYLALNGSCDDPESIFFHFDANCFLLSKSQVNYLGFFSVFMICYFNAKLFLGPDMTLLKLLERILGPNDRGANFFIWPKAVGERKRACAQVRAMFLGTLNAFLSLVFSFGKYCKIESS